MQTMMRPPAARISGSHGEGAEAETRKSKQKLPAVEVPQHAHEPGLDAAALHRADDVQYA